MDNDFENLEEKLKKQEKQKKEPKVSGRSVFKLQEIIKEKSRVQKHQEKVDSQTHD